MITINSMYVKNSNIKRECIYNDKKYSNFVSSQDTFKKGMNNLSNLTMFKGNILNSGILEKESTKPVLSSKIKLFKDECIELFRKIKTSNIKNDELPFSPNPIIAETQNDDEIIKKAKEIINNPSTPQSVKDQLTKQIKEVKPYSKLTPENANQNDINALENATKEAEEKAKEATKKSNPSMKGNGDAPQENNELHSKDPNEINSNDTLDTNKGDFERIHSDDIDVNDIDNSDLEIDVDDVDINSSDLDLDIKDLDLDMPDLTVEDIDLESLNMPDLNIELFDLSDIKVPDIDFDLSDFIDLTDLLL